MHVDAVPAGGDCHAEAFVITLDLAHMMPLELALGRAGLIDAKSLDLQRVFAADLFLANAVQRQRLENVHEVPRRQGGLAPAFRFRPRTSAPPSPHRGPRTRETASATPA